MNKTKKKLKSRIITIPSNLTRPISDLLKNQLVDLRKRKKEISSEDPFKDQSRLLDNASWDADAEEQFGHARTSALKTALNRKIVQVRKALARIKIGKYGICEDCGEMIDTDRLMVYPEATLCAKDAAKREK